MLEADRPYAYLAECEPDRDARGQLTIAETSTIFLTASRCPVGCTMCDLHLNTLPGPTLPGSIPRQIRFAQQQLPEASRVKLYNSGNFFDAASIPPVDYEAIAEHCDRYHRVIIENHPRFGRSRHCQFRDQLKGRLEIAVGLETVQPGMLDRLKKQMSRDDFDRYARFLRACQIDLRVFVIVGSPALTPDESIRWARLTIRHAALAGARHISLIPARWGQGWNGRADRLPKIRLRHLADLYLAAVDDLDGSCCLSVDLWDVPRDSLNEQELQFLRRFESAILHQRTSIE